MALCFSWACIKLDWTTAFFATPSHYPIPELSRTVRFGVAAPQSRRWISSHLPTRGAVNGYECIDCVPDARTSARRQVHSDFLRDEACPFPLLKAVLLLDLVALHDCNLGLSIYEAFHCPYYMIARNTHEGAHTHTRTYLLALRTIA